MNRFHIDKKFVSDIDKFLHDFDQQHPEKSASQQAEIKKAERIARLRDDPHAEHHNLGEIWEEF